MSMQFAPTRYGPAVAALLQDAGLNELGPGTPRAALCPALQSLVPEAIAAPHAVRDADRFNSASGSCCSTIATGGPSARERLVESGIWRRRVLGRRHGRCAAWRIGGELAAGAGRFSWLEGATVRETGHFPRAASLVHFRQSRYIHGFLFERRGLPTGRVDCFRRDSVA